MSATQSYPISWITSGAIQYGVPITVFRLAIVSCCKIIHHIHNSFLVFRCQVITFICCMLQNQYQLVLTNYQLIVCIRPDITAVHLQLAVLAPHSLDVYPF